MHNTQTKPPQCAGDREYDMAHGILIGAVATFQRKVAALNHGERQSPELVPLFLSTILTDSCSREEVIAFVESIGEMWDKTKAQK